MGHQSGWFFVPDDEEFHFTYHPDTRVVNMVNDLADDDEDDIIKSWDNKTFDNLEEFEDFCNERIILRIEKMEEG